MGPADNHPPRQTWPSWSPLPGGAPNALFLSSCRDGPGMLNGRTPEMTLAFPGFLFGAPCCLAPFGPSGRLSPPAPAYPDTGPSWHMPSLAFFLCLPFPSLLPPGAPVPRKHQEPAVSPAAPGGIHFQSPHLSPLSSGYLHPFHQ